MKKFASEFKETKLTKTVDKILGYCGKCFGSKSGYRHSHPNDLFVFNANIYTKEDGKIWHGDINLTLENKNLVKLSKSLKKTIYVLYEMDGRFENENKPKYNNFIYMVKYSKNKIEEIIGESYIKYGYKFSDGIPKYDPEMIYRGKKIVKVIDVEDFDIFLSDKKSDDDSPIFKFHKFLSEEMEIDIKKWNVNSVFIHEDDNDYLKFLTGRWIKKTQKHIPSYKIPSTVAYHTMDIGPNVFTKETELFFTLWDRIKRRINRIFKTNFNVKYYTDMKVLPFWVKPGTIYISEDYERKE